MSRIKPERAEAEAPLSLAARRERGREPDVQIEAMIERTDQRTGETWIEWVPIGRASRTDGGHYIGELRAEPPEWRHSPQRRLFFRVKKE